MGDILATQAVDERFLQALGVHRLELPVPFLEAGGPVNVYAIEDGVGWALFDAGIGNEVGRETLFALARARGIELRRLTRIIVSHGHVDHYGNAQELSALSGAPVFVHPHDREKLTGEGRWASQLQEHLPYFRRLGIPNEVLTAMAATAGGSAKYARQVEASRVQPLEHGQRLNFARFSAEVLHLPGHTPGLVCLWAAEQKLLFADDHVLARVSPNPLLDFIFGAGPEKFRALEAYMASARAVQALELDCLLPGHGPAFRGHRELLESLFGFYAKRQEKLLERVKQSPATVFELLAAIFPRFVPGRLYLMLSEVLGNLEVMETQGRVLRLDDGPAFRFAPHALHS